MEDVVRSCCWRSSISGSARVLRIPPVGTARRLEWVAVAIWVGSFVKILLTYTTTSAVCTSDDLFFFFFQNCFYYVSF